VQRVAANDPRLDGYRGLADAAPRHPDTFVAESKTVVRRLLEAGRHRIRSILATEAALVDLEASLRATTTPPDVFVAEAAVLRQVAGYAFHRGCLALVARGAPAGLDAVLAAVPAGPACVLVLDEVTDPDNVGALFRNAAAFGVAAVLLSAGCGDPCYRKAIRVSVGATLVLPFTRCGDWATTAKALTAHGFSTAALSPDGIDLERVVPGAPERLALVVGAEGAGVSPATRAAVQQRVGIPMGAAMDSLNVATAAAIALYRLTRAKRAQTG
jgi:tRNA G18 (ribose-2'-O)-methylase SpoU